MPVNDPLAATLAALSVAVADTPMHRWVFHVLSDAREKEKTGTSNFAARGRPAPF
jgi:hypothetical protein